MARSRTDAPYGVRVTETDKPCEISASALPEACSLERIADLDAAEAPVVAIMGPDDPDAVVEHQTHQVGVRYKVARRGGIGDYLAEALPEALLLAGRLDVRTASAADSGRRKTAGWVAIRR